MKISVALLMACAVLGASFVNGGRSRFSRKRPGKAQVTRMGKSKDGSESIKVDLNDKKSMMLEMFKNKMLDRKTKTFEIKDNGRKEVPHGPRGCFAQDKNGAAALNLCDDESVSGVVNPDSGVMEKIVPMKKFHTNHTRQEEEAKGMVERRRRSTAVPHRLERVKREDDISADFVVHLNLDEVESRERRQTAGPEAEVELAFVADYKMYQQYGSVQATKDYILSVANIIDVFYKTVTYPKITISVSSIYVITDMDSQPWINNVVYSDGNTVESGDLLEAFSTWLTTGPLDDEYDHAMLLTGLDLCSASSNGLCSTSNSGLAWVSNACSKYGNKVYASSVSEDHGGYSRVFTIAHELGHNLGAAHDGSSNSAGGPGATSCLKSDGYIMGSPKTHQAFSTCTTDQFQYYLTLSKANCLYATSSNSLYEIPKELPGATTSIDQQCKALYGEESVKCSWKDTDVCESLWCTSGGNYCGSSGAALMGTPCPGGFCYSGECVNSLPGENVEDVDGGWSDWGDFGSCSVSCGGGTQTRSRTCSNPYPQGNGAQCTGPATETISCGTTECPADPCYLGDASAPSGCSDSNILITYNGASYNCQCFLHETGQVFCNHNIITAYCCESRAKACGA